MAEVKDIVIKADHVYKNFRLPHEKATTIKSMFTNLLKGKKNHTVEVQHALKDISFEVKKGEFFGIVGRNGSGKSTLLKILAGIYQPTKGHVTVKGKLVPFIELGVGFNPELSGRENVYLNGSLLGFSRPEVDAMYEQIVEFAELEEFMDQKLKNYSSGMQVRLAFSLAIRAQADILLIDEVLAVGDADFQRKCFRYFKEIKSRETTVIFVTHDMNAVREYCDRGILIEDHQIVATDKAEKIARMYDQLMMPSTDEVSSKDPDRYKKKRWGDGTLKLSRPGIVNMDDREIVFQATITAAKGCKDPVFGFVLRNAAGESLLGTNTVLNKVKIKPMAKNERRLINCAVPNIFPDGEYSIALAAQYDSGMTSGDWWEDACEFSVNKITRTPYPIQPAIDISVKETT